MSSLLERIEILTANHGAGSMVDGHQTTSCVEGWKEQHISLDVALAVWEAASAAGNPAFTREEAWPVLRGVSEWIGARGVWTARGFEIHNSTCSPCPYSSEASHEQRCTVEGPDEGIGQVNNSNYVNVAAMMVLERAIHCHDTLLPPSLQDRAAVERWQRILQRFYLPHEGDVVLPFDGASIENCTVHSWSIGNLAYLYPHGLPARINDTVLNATFAVEEKLRTNFSVASSLPCRGAPYFACPPIAGQAALLGQREKAAALLRLAYDNYTLPPWHLLRESRRLSSAIAMALCWQRFRLSTASGVLVARTGEYSGYNFGMYITHAGSMLTTIYSMLGISTQGVQPSFSASTAPQFVRNVSLPAGWETVSIERLYFGGRVFSAEGAHGGALRLLPAAE